MTEPVRAVRTAVRRSVRDLPAERPLIVACSGGADSVALAAATVWIGRSSARPVMAVIIDHGLVAGSAEVAATTAATCTSLGLEPVMVRAVDARSHPGGAGPEAAAREARREALGEIAADVEAGAVLLGHTRDDQAETVLVQLARGSGARSLAGMRPVSGIFRRPFLDLPRATVRQSVRDLELPFHEDPWNTDPRFTRSRVRAVVLPTLHDELGPGVAQSLARTADLLRDDADLLDDLATTALRDLTVDGPPEVTALRGLPRALRTRAVRGLLIDAGCPAGDLTRHHVVAVERLVMEPRTNGPIHLPAGFTAHRRCGRLVVEDPSGLAHPTRADKEC